MIFLAPVRSYGVLDLPLESGDSARIFLLNLAVSKLFVIHSLTFSNESPPILYV